MTEATLRRRLAANMRRLRAEQSLTQVDAAGRVEMDVRSWQRFEAAEVNTTLDTLTRIANALGVQPADLLSPAPRRKR